MDAMGADRGSGRGLMQLWTPPREQPELQAWWVALISVARLARADRVPWPVHIDEFDLLGRVDRGGQREPVWVFRHQVSGRDIFADVTGQTYRYRVTPKATGAGRFDRCDLRTSLSLAGLPEVVEPVWYEPRLPPPANDRPGWGIDGRAAHPAAPGHGGCRPTRPRVPRRNRWLHLVPSVPA